jgi:hypothetical protein
MSDGPPVSLQVISYLSCWKSGSNILLSVFVLATGGTPESAVNYPDHPIGDAPGTARRGQLGPDQAVEAERDQHHADGKPQARRRRPTQYLAADRHTNDAPDQERCKPGRFDRLIDRAYEQLVEAIANGTLAPGQRIRLRTSTGLKFTRWMRNSLPPPSYVKAASFQGRLDRCQEFEFVAPNTILQWTGATDAGTATDNPQRDLRFQFRLFHGLTPETETSCFYFWSAANGYRQNDPEATEQLYREIAPTFLEDKEMVEAQQRRLDELGERGLVDIASDANRMHMRRMVERLIVGEQSAAAGQ